MNDIDTVELKIGKRTVRVLKGKEAKVILKAMHLVLEMAETPKKVKIDIIDTGMPKDFSYSKAIIEALELGLKNPIEIADYIIKKIEKEPQI